MEGLFLGDTQRGKKASRKSKVSLWGEKGPLGEGGDLMQGQSCEATRLVTQGKMSIPRMFTVSFTLKAETVALICLFVWIGGTI